MNMKMAFTCFYLTNSLFLLFMVIVFANNGGYGPIPNPEQPRPEKKEHLLTTMIAIQGIVYCQSGSTRFPLEGAVTRITCLSTDKYGYETAPISILSGATDAKGYFIATLSPSEVPDELKIEECKTFLELSPLETCNMPTNVNNGINGSLLASYNFLPGKKMKLFTVGPFFFASEPKSVSNGY